MNPSFITCLIGMAVNVAWAETAHGEKTTIGRNTVVVFNGLKFGQWQQPQYLVSDITYECTHFATEQTALKRCLSLCLSSHPKECTHFDFDGHDCMRYGDDHWYRIHQTYFHCHLLNIGLKDGDEINTNLMERDDNWRHFDVREEKGKKRDQEKLKNMGNRAKHLQFRETGSVSGMKKPQ